MYKLKKNWEGNLPVNLLGLGPRLIKKRIYRAAFSQSLRNTALNHATTASFQTVASDIVQSEIATDGIAEKAQTTPIQNNGQYYSSIYLDL